MGKEVFLCYNKIPITPEQETTFTSILPLDTLNILLKYGVIAGGSVVHLFVNRPNTVPEDIDVFILNGDRANLSGLLADLHVKYPLAIWSSFGSVIQMKAENLVPIQIVFDSRKTPEALLTSFDMDYVQCAVLQHNSTIHTLRSTLAEAAHWKNRIEYVSKTRFYRLRKAKTKGFILSEDYKRFLNAQPNAVRRSVEYAPVPFESIMRSVDVLSPLYGRLSYDKGADPNLTPTIYEFVHHPDATEASRQRLREMEASNNEHDLIISNHLQHGSFKKALRYAFYMTPGISMIPALINAANHQSMEDILILIDSVRQGQVAPLFKYKLDTHLGVGCTPVTLTLSDQEIVCPKEILMKLEYFERLFANNMREAQSNQIELREPDAEPIIHLLHYIAKPYPRTICKLSYEQICYLHSICDFFMADKCAETCIKVLCSHLCDATSYDLGCYLTEIRTGSGIIQLREAFAQYIRKSSIFIDRIMQLFTEAERDFIITECTGHEETRLLLRLGWALGLKPEDRHTFLRGITLPDSLKSLGSEAGRIMNIITELRDPDLLITALTLTSRATIPSGPYPVKQSVVRLEDFVISKVTFSPLTELAIRDSDGNIRRIKKLVIMYDGNPDWVIPLPDLIFAGFHRSWYDGAQSIRRYEATFRVPTHKLETWQPLVEFFRKYEQVIKQYVANSQEYRNATGLNRQREEFEIVSSLRRETEPRRTEMGAKLNSVKATLRDYFDGKELKPDNIDIQTRTRFEEYTMHNGLLSVNTLYPITDTPRAVISREIVYGLIEAPDFKPIVNIIATPPDSIENLQNIIDAEPDMVADLDNQLVRFLQGQVPQPGVIQMPSAIQLPQI